MRMQEATWPRREDKESQEPEETAVRVRGMSLIYPTSETSIPQQTLANLPPVLPTFEYHIFLALQE